MKGRLLAYSSNPTDPVLVYRLIVIPQLLCLWIVEFVERDFGGGACGTR